VLQLFTSLDFMHSQNLIHRDIKLENILIDRADNGSVFLNLTDFGFATKLAKG